MRIRSVRSEGVSMRAGRSKSHSGCTRKRLEQSLKTKSKTKSSNGKAQHIIIPHNRLHRSPTNLAAGIHHHHLGRQLQETKAHFDLRATGCCSLTFAGSGRSSSRSPQTTVGTGRERRTAVVGAGHCSHLRRRHCLDKGTSVRN